MHCNELQDLALAGVRWELTDMPFAMSQRAAVAAAARAAGDNVSTDSASVCRAQESISALRTPTSVVPPIAPTTAISADTARAMAARPGDIDALLRMISEFGHPLRAAATNVVLPHIAPKPNGLVIVTDIPSADDDASGRILSGAAGELLDKMIGAIGMTRDNVSIVPILFWRTPGGRTPTGDELALARPFVVRALDFLSPRLVLTLGTLVATDIAGATLPRDHGTICNSSMGIKCVPIFHPNYLLLKPTAKREAWDALQKIQNLLKSPDK